MQGQIDLQKEVLTLRQENAYLKEELAQLKRMIFAGRRERFIPSDTTQHALFAEQEAVEASAQKTITYQREKPRKTGKAKRLLTFPERSSSSYIDWAVCML